MEHIELQGHKVIYNGGGGGGDYLESLFFTGNGTMGARGFRAVRTGDEPSTDGIFIAGVFDNITVAITDMVNCGNIFETEILVDGVRWDNSTEVRLTRQELDMASGQMSVDYRLQRDGQILLVSEKRFFSRDNTHLCSQSIDVTAESFSGKITLLSILREKTYNVPIHDDQVKENTGTVSYLDTVEAYEEGGLLLARATTRTTKLDIGYATDIQTDSDTEVSISMEKGFVHTASALLHQGEKLPLTRTTAIYTSRSAQNVLGSAREALSPRRTYNELLQKSIQKWEPLFERCRITAAGELGTALDFNVFGLLSSNARDDGTVSIGARGLTHSRYKGCYFWDTEIFMLPFYLLSDPQAARKLLEYRYHTLDAARRHARKMSSRGARYPWMTSYDGSEQCETWDIGACEVHITADVAYAVDSYIQWTGDTEFLYTMGAEIYIETARFWADRFSYESTTDTYNMLFVKGPDEYCGATSNNTYTNFMAVYNLKLALDAVETMSRESPKVYGVLSERLSLQKNELLKFKDIVSKVVFKKLPGSECYRQDDTFELLEPVNPSSIKESDAAAYKSICFDRLQRYKLLKQADLLLLFALFPDSFTGEEIRASYDYYEPKTLHDSTLSFGIHALIASIAGKPEDASAYFEKGVYLDLRDIMQNTGKEGLHLAALGAAWQAVVFGFAGLHIESGVPKLTPRLPEGLHSFSFRFSYQGENYKASVDKNGGAITKLP